MSIKKLKTEWKDCPRCGGKKTLAKLITGDWYCKKCQHFEIKKEKKDE